MISMASLVAWPSLLGVLFFGQRAIWLTLETLQTTRSIKIIILYTIIYMAVCQNLVPLVNIKIAGKWMFIPLKMVLIGIDPYPHDSPPLIAKEK